MLRPPITTAFQGGAFHGNTHTLLGRVRGTHDQRRKTAGWAAACQQVAAMDLTQFSNVSGVLGVITPLLLVCAFIWLWLRTQSRHVLLYRLWRLLHGSQPIHDPEVNAFIEEQTSLMSFRFLTGVQAKTLGTARTLIQWARLNDVAMQDIATCGEYFDPDLRQVRASKLPSRWQQNLMAGMTILGWLATVGMAVGMSVNDA